MRIFSNENKVGIVTVICVCSVRRIWMELMWEKLANGERFFQRELMFGAETAGIC